MDWDARARRELRRHAHCAACAKTHGHKAKGPPGKPTRRPRCTMKPSEGKSQHFQPASAARQTAQPNARRSSHVPQGTRHRRRTNDGGEAHTSSPPCAPSNQSELTAPTSAWGKPKPNKDGHSTKSKHAEEQEANQSKEYMEYGICNKATQIG